MDKLFKPEQNNSEYEEEVKNTTHTYIPDTTTGKPVDNTTNPIGQGRSTTPNSSKWPMNFDMASDPFVQRVIDNRRIFADHELEYLDNNCPDDVVTEHQEIMDELEKKIDEEIFRDILDQIEDDDPYDNPFDKDDHSDDYRDWTRRNPYDDNDKWGPQPLISSSGGTGTFETEEEIQQAIKFDERV